MSQIISYLDPGEGSLIIVYALLGIVALVLVVGGWIFNIFGLIDASKSGKEETTLMILHAIGIFLVCLGSILGWLWLFVWSKDKRAKANT